MNNRAVIYIRTSSEHQGEKSSPMEQEADCRKLADDQGLEIVNVYRDIEKYRVRNKLVEPSGTRYDRPGLVAMLQDAASDKFDVILAWKEDRLYRGMRAMLMVLETIQEYRISVLLAKETYDPKIAPLRAWVAQMELEGMKERMTMGVKARLKAGKANTGQDRYGYKRNGEVIEIVDDEAFWVRQIFAWYIAGMPLMEIRERLIAANAPQKGSSRPRRVQWARSSIQTVLNSAKEYAYGIKIQRRKGEAFQIPVEPIIDIPTYEKFIQLREKKNTHRVRNIKYEYLIGGLLYCSCERKWGARTNKSKRNRRNELIQRKTPIGVYYCGQNHKELISPECPRTIGSKKADAIVWEKVCEAINNPEHLLRMARKFVEELREKADTLHIDRARIKKELEVIIENRNWVITQARQRKFTATDMEYQLGILTVQEVSLKRELASLGRSININALENWETKVSAYLEDLQVGIEELKNAAPQTKEERHEIFLFKKRIVNTFVSRVTIDKNRDLKVEIRMDLLDLGGEDPDQGDSTGVQVSKDGTYTRIQSSPAHLHLLSFSL
ncbi:MAG: hypothetical protein Kow002_02740 [Anaerolineales bacterium]